MRTDDLTESFIEEIREIAAQCGVKVLAVDRERWDPEAFDDPGKPLYHVSFDTPSGLCELHFDADGAEVIWKDRIARFEREDFPGGKIKEAVKNCLLLVFSGRAHENPEAFPTASGCMLVATFPFIWPLGKVYHGFKKKKKGSKSSDE